MVQAIIGLIVVTLVGTIMLVFCVGIAVTLRRIK